MTPARFIDFPIIDVPDLDAVIAEWEGLVPAIGAEPEHRPLLVLFDGTAEDQAFLESILKAAAYEEPSQQAWLLPWAKGQQLDLASLTRHLGVKQIMLFGQDLPPLGLHLQLAAYVPVQLAGVWYLLADKLSLIQKEKAAGQNAKAGALWKAVKSQFLFTSTTT